jgi:hypothetical protein
VSDVEEARRELEEKRREDAARQIQSAWRGRKPPMTEEEAARIMQANVRRYHRNPGVLSVRWCGIERPAVIASVLVLVLVLVLGDHVRKEAVQREAILFGSTTRDMAQSASCCVVLTHMQAW